MTGAAGAAGGAAPKLSVLIVAYNSLAHIDACIGSLIRHTRGVTLEILLLDNGTDGTGAFVTERFPEVRVVPPVAISASARATITSSLMPPRPTCWC